METITLEQIRETEGRLAELRAPAFLRLQQKLRKLQPAIDEYLHAASGRLGESAHNRLLYTAAVIRMLYSDRRPQLRKVSADHLADSGAQERALDRVVAGGAQAQAVLQHLSADPSAGVRSSQTREGLKPGESARVLVRLKTILDVLIDSVRLSRIGNRLWTPPTRSGSA